MIKITKDVSISENELIYTFSLSSKPGGQHVNKASTRVTLQFDVARTPGLSEKQREMIRERLRTRMSKKGILRIVSQRHRSQRANREAATERFVELMREALKEKLPRKKKQIPPAAMERRIKDKKHRSRLKKERSSVWEPDD